MDPVGDAPHRVFVLSGGASLGAVQVGMLRALFEWGIRPDAVVGTSVGALNGAALAQDPTTEGVERLAALWSRLRRDDIFPTRPVTAMLGLTRQRDGLVSSDGLRRLLARELPARRFEQLKVPLRVVAVDLVTGGEVVLGAGELHPAVMASAAIPGVFPPVLVSGRTLVDGGIRNNTPISLGLTDAATEVWVLSTGHACALAQAPRGPLSVTLQALNLLVSQRLAAELQERRSDRRIRLVPPPCPLGVGAGDFSHGRELVEAGHATAATWLRSYTGDGDVAALPLLTDHGH